MNSKHRDILQQHRTFLLNNLVWTEELANKLLMNGVITDTIIKDIKNGSVVGRNSKITKLLDILPMRGANTFEKFCDSLQLSGHVFLAELLRDEDTVPETIDIKDLNKRLPFLEKTIKEEDIKIIETYVTEKAKEAVMKSVWGKSSREKDKAVEAKKELLEQSFDFAEKMRLKNEEIAKLEQQINAVKEEKLEIQSKMRFMDSKLHEAEDKFKSDFGVQMKFSLANENAIKKLTARLEQAEEVLHNVDKVLKDIVRLPSRTSEREQMAKIEFPYAFLFDDFELFADKFKLLIEIEKQYENLVHERNYILSHLGYKVDDENKPSLLTAYRDFAVRTDEDMRALKEQVEHFNDTIEGQKERIESLNKENNDKQKFKMAGNVWQSAMMGVMRNQLNDVKHENRIKDSKLKHYEGEIAKLKGKVNELEAIVKDKVSNAGSGKEHHGHTHRDSTTKLVHNAPDALVNGYLASVNGMEDDLESLSKSEINKVRNNRLPPLGGKILYQASEVQVQQSPRRSKPKNVVQITRTDGKPAVAVPEGLMTQQVRLENRGQPQFGAHNPGKVGHQMGHGLGDLKAMHGKQTKAGQKMIS